MVLKDFYLAGEKILLLPTHSITAVTFYRCITEVILRLSMMDISYRFSINRKEIFEILIYWDLKCKSNDLPMYDHSNSERDFVYGKFD